jgi:hypothetical protein
MTVIYPDPLPDARAYLAEIQKLEAEIAAAEKELGKMRRLRGLRLMQLAELEPGQDLLRDR